MNRSLNSTRIGLIAILVTIHLSAQVPAPALRIGIVGDPVHTVPWTDEALERLKDIGFNAVQLNLAWEPNPIQDPLTLADVVTLPGETPLPGTPERCAKLKQRVALAQRHGLRMLLNLSTPNMARNPHTGEVSNIVERYDDVTFDSWYDILNPKVRDHELALLKELRRQFPEVTDILFYTYDNESFQTPEFSYNPFSYGIPLADRLPDYLTALQQVWTEGRPGRARLWWEPWELSAGQTYAMLPRLPRSDFGLIIHTSNIEVQLARPVDVWFRNTVRMCQAFGIPVIAEAFFASTSEEIEPLSIPAPRLVDEAYLAIVRVPGIVGIKEYYGSNGDTPDFNLDLLRSRLKDPAQSTEMLLTRITARFGAAQGDVRAYLGLLADAIQTYPWDASWTARLVGRASTDHGWRAATINSGSAPTPAWKSANHAGFMRTGGDETQPHFWMLEDVQLRCELTAQLLDQASVVATRFQSKLSTSADRDQFERIEKDVDVLRRVVRSYALHIRETNVAEMLRQDLAANRPMTAALVDELGRLLDADVANQQEHGRVIEMRWLYRKNPREFVRRYLVPVNAIPSQDLDSPDLPATDRAAPEKGLFTLTTR